MKQNAIKPAAVKRLMMIVLCAILCSFASKPGSHSYKIYLNDKLLVQKYVSDKKDVAIVSLDSDDGQGQLSITYDQCGVIGSARKIMIKNEQNKILREWHFADASDLKNPMTCKVKDIVALRHGHNELSLFYSSKELSADVSLATVHIVDKTAAK